MAKDTELIKIKLLAKGERSTLTGGRGKGCHKKAGDIVEVTAAEAHDAVMSGRWAYVEKPKAKAVEPEKKG